MFYHVSYWSFNGAYISTRESSESSYRPLNYICLNFKQWCVRFRNPNVLSSPVWLFHFTQVFSKCLADIFIASTPCSCPLATAPLSGLFPVATQALMISSTSPDSLLLTRTARFIIKEPLEASVVSHLPARAPTSAACPVPECGKILESSVREIGVNISSNSRDL